MSVDLDSVCASSNRRVACLDIDSVCASSNRRVASLLSDLKNEPYRRADAIRRSQRRRVELTKDDGNGTIQQF